MISTKAIQLQLLLNHVLLKVKFKTRMITIESKPHGNNRKVEGFEGVGMIGQFGIKIGKSVEPLFRKNNFTQKP